jgi:hypothetical protein
MGKLTALALLAAALATPTGAASVDVQFDPAVDFDRYRTFALHVGTAARRIEVQNRIEGYVAYELASRGLMQVERSPDLVVRIYCLVDRLTPQQLADPDTWAFYTGLVDVDAYDVKAGTLVIDLLEASGGDGGERRVWRGVVSAPVHGSTASVERKIEKAVHKMFRRLPRD